jgi:very-short-patch-repair endonuclease
METRLRMILVLGGLPRPRVQVELRDASGGFLARPDLLYPEARLAIEYDGSNHRNRLVADNRRQNRLQRAGYSMLRYTGPDVSDRPQAVVAEVAAELARLRTPARGSPSG